MARLNAFWMGGVVAVAVVGACSGATYSWSGSYDASTTVMFANGCDSYGHVYEVSNVSTVAYAIDSNGDYRQPYQEFLDAINARRCLHSVDYTKDANVRWVKALASTARQYLESGPTTGMMVSTVGTTKYLRHEYIGNEPGQIVEMVRNWYDTNEHCTDDPASGAGCTVNAGSDDDDDDTSAGSPEAYMRLVWLRTRSIGCACVGAQVACIVDAGANVSADADDENVVSQSTVQIDNYCDDECDVCDEINGGACKSQMVGVQRSNVTLDTCSGSTTTSLSIPKAAASKDADDDGLSDIAIAMIIAASVVSAMIVCLGVVFRHEIVETIGPKYFKSYVPRLWKKEEKGAVKLAQARQNEMSLLRKDMRETIKRTKSMTGSHHIQPSVMLDPLYNPMINAPVDGDPNDAAHATAPASHFITSNDVLAVHKDLIEKRKSDRLKSIKQKESSMRRRAAAAAPKSEFMSQGEVSL